MVNRGRTFGSVLLSGLLAFNLFGFVTSGHAETVAADEPISGFGDVSDVLPAADDDLDVTPFAIEGAGAEGSEDASAEEPEAVEPPDGENQADAPDLAQEAPQVEEPADDVATLALAVPASEASTTDALSYAQPGPGDFEFANGVIAGLSRAYVASLADEQKKDIRLVIPAEINGTPVTGIGVDAFSKVKAENKDLTFTDLDLSGATSLQSIGLQAFYGASSLSGDLIIPNSVTTLGNTAFSNCGYTGTLHLPENSDFQIIPNQAFSGTKFTGTLHIPASVKVIQRLAFNGTNFSGAVEIPEGVEEMWASAFEECASITSVSIPSTLDFKKKDSDSGHHFQNCTSLERITFAPNSKVTSLYSQMFAYCPQLKVLELPDSIANIDAKAFYNCGLKTVYLPKSATITANASSFLYNCPGAVAVCQDKTSYDAYVSQFSTKQQQYLSYPITVTFDAGSYGASPEPIERLYNRPFNMVKDSEAHVWAVDEDYTFALPGGVGQPAEGSWFAWSFDAAGSQPATETTSTGTGGDVTLHGQGVKIADPVIEYNFPQRVGKVYDGEDMTLSVSASHPLAVDPAKAKVGDYVFAYRWMVAENGKAKVKKQGFDPTLSLCDVSDSITDPKYGIVYVYFYQVKDPNKVLDFSTTKASYAFYYVQIQPAAPTVNPVVAAGESALAGFPALAISSGDTPGTVSWDAGQTLAEGTHSYTWTFTPDPPAAGKQANYKTATGSMELRVVDGKVVQRVSFDTAGGSAVEAIDVPSGTALPGGLVSVRDGYVFCGWYQDAACTTPWDASSPVIGDMTLHARWEKRAASVDPGKDDVVINGQPVDQGAHTVDIVHEAEIAPDHQDVFESVSLPEGVVPSKFFELKLVVDGVPMEKAEFDRELSVTVSHPVKDGTLYRIMHLKHDGAMETLDAVPSVEAQTLTFSVASLSPFMVIEQPLCQVTFDTAGGSAVAPIVDVPAGSHVSAPQAPTRSGYDFAGWFSDEACTKTWDFAKNAVGEDITLYAAWTEKKGGESGSNKPGGKPKPEEGDGDQNNDGNQDDGDDATTDNPPANDPAPQGKPLPSKGFAPATGDNATALPLLGLTVALAALALCVRHARRRMRGYSE